MESAQEHYRLEEIQIVHPSPLVSPALTFLFISCVQTVLRLTQSSTLPASCSRLLLQITSSLLLGENISLQKSLIKEMIQKVWSGSLNIRFFLCLRGFTHAKDVKRSFLSQGFRQHVGKRSDPGIHKGDVHNERVWTGESPQLRCFVSSSLRVTSDILSSSGSSSFPPCCALLPACSAPVILYPATLAWMCWSAWSSPKPRPPQMVPWLLKRTRCSSLDRPLGQILRTIFLFPTSIPPVFLENAVSHAGVLARRSPAAWPISQESQRWCCLWSHLLERWQSSLTSHCCGALWCFCHTSGNTHIILCVWYMMSQFKNCLCSNWTLRTFEAA